MKKYSLFIIVSIILLSCEQTEVINEENCLEQPNICLELMEDNNTRNGSLSMDNPGVFKISVSGISDAYNVYLSGPNGFYYSSGLNHSSFYTTVTAGSYGAYNLEIRCANGCHNSSTHYYYSLQDGNPSVNKGRPVPPKWNQTCSHHIGNFLEKAKLEKHYIEHKFGDPMVVFKLYIPGYDGPMGLEIEEMGDVNSEPLYYEKNRKDLESGKVERAFFYHTSSSSYFEVRMFIPDYFANDIKKYRIRMYNMNYSNSTAYPSTHASECTNYVLGDFFLGHKGQYNSDYREVISFKMQTVVTAVPYYGDFLD